MVHVPLQTRYWMELRLITVLYGQIDARVVQIKSQVSHHFRLFAYTIQFCLTLPKKDNRTQKAHSQNSLQSSSSPENFPSHSSFSDALLTKISTVELKSIYIRWLENSKIHYKCNPFPFHTFTACGKKAIASLNYTLIYFKAKYSRTWCCGGIV